MKRRITPVVAALGVATLLAACGTSKAAPEATITATPVATSAAAAPGQDVLNITVTATAVTPVGATATVGVNKPFTLRISATVAGELHVHSTPEEHVAYPAGTSEATLSFKVPGNVVIEDHALDRQIVQVTVR